MRGDEKQKRALETMSRKKREQRQERKERERERGRGRERERERNRRGKDRIKTRRREPRQRVDCCSISENTWGASGSFVVIDERCFIAP